MLCPFYHWIKLEEEAYQGVSSFGEVQENIGVKRKIIVHIKGTKGVILIQRRLIQVNLPYIEMK